MKDAAAIATEMRTWAEDQKAKADVVLKIADSLDRLEQQAKQLKAKRTRGPDRKPRKRPVRRKEQKLLTTEILIRYKRGWMWIPGHSAWQRPRPAAHAASLEATMSVDPRHRTALLRREAEGFRLQALRAFGGHRRALFEPG